MLSTTRLQDCLRGPRDDENVCYVEEVALRFAGIAGLSLLVFLLPALGMAVNGGQWGWVGAFVLLALGLTLLARLWWAGVTLIRQSSQRDGKVFIIKIVCAAFLGMFAWAFITDGRFDFGTLSFVYSLVEFIFFCLAMVYLSLAIFSGTQVPWSAWVMIALSWIGLTPPLLKIARDFNLLAGG